MKRPDWHTALLALWPAKLRALRLKQRKQGKTTVSLPFVLPAQVFDTHTTAEQPAPRPPALLHVLAPELVAHVLQYLDRTSLLRFSAACRRFHDIVQASPDLQYYIECSAAGVDDGPASRRSVRERLHALRAQQAAWHAFSYRDRLTVRMGPGAFRPCYDLHGGMFFVGRRPGAHMPIRRLSWLELPTIDAPELPAWHAYDLPVDIDDFALDLHQDLLALVEMLVPQSETIRVHLLAFGTQAAHVRARTPLLRMDCQPVGGLSTVVIDVCGAHLGLLFNSDYTRFTHNDALTVWDWTTGEIRCVVSQHYAKLTSFVFLNEHAFLVPNISGNAVEVFTQPGGGDGTFECACSFGLPETAAGCQLVTANSRYKARGLHARPPSTSSTDAEPRAQHTRPAFPARDAELVVVSLEYRTEGAQLHHFHLLAHKGAFLAGAAAHPPLTEDASGWRMHGAGHPVSWAEWGPRTRLLREPPRAWDYFFSGLRYIALDPDAAGGSGRARIRVLDFSRAAIARGGADGADATRASRVVRAAGVVRAGAVFAADVATGMPYVETTTLCAFPVANVLCDHERVLALHTNQNLDMESLDVFLM